MPCGEQNFAFIFLKISLRKTYKVIKSVVFVLYFVYDVFRQKKGCIYEEKIIVFNFSYDNSDILYGFWLAYKRGDY